MDMRLKNLFKKEYIIGLDIGSSSVKIARFQSKTDGLHLVRAELKEIGYAADEETREKELLQALKYLLKGVDIKRSRVIVAINCPGTAVKKIVAPYMPKSELKRGIILEAKNYFTFFVDDSYIDFEVLGDIVEGGVRKYEVLVAVSPAKTVDRYLGLLRKAGVRPSSFVPYPYVLKKLAGQFYSGDDRVRYFLMIGRSDSELVALKGGALAFSRKIPVTGDDFTSALTDVLASDRGRTELTREEAERVKRGVGIPGEGESRIIDGKISASQISSMLRAPLERLVTEVERCFDYYREETGGRADSLILLGGGASLKGLPEFLSKELEMEVRLGDVLDGLKVDAGAFSGREALSYRLELAVGSALAGGGGINLLPPEIKEETERVVKRGTIEAVATAVIIASILVYMGMRIKIDNFEKRIAVARMEFASLAPELAKARAQALANKVLLDEPQWEDIFKEISNLLPDTVHIEELKMADNIITMKGIVDADRGEEIIASFILTLEKGIFDNVKLVSSKDLEGAPGEEFELKCWVDYEDL